jgi:hypothetical protein
MAAIAIHRSLMRWCLLLVLWHFVGISAGFADGFVVEQLTSGPDAHFNPTVSSSGELLYSTADDLGVLQIFSDTRGQLTEDGGDKRSPKISDAGDLMWIESATDGLSHIFVRRASGDTIELGDPDVQRFPGDMSDNGQIVYVQSDPGVGFQIHFFSFADGDTVVVPFDAEPARPIQGVTINDSGEIVWAPQESGTVSLGLYSTVRGFIVEEVAEHWAPAMNNLGEVVWYQKDGNGTWQIYHSEFGQITTGEQDKRWPEITDSGEIYWVGKDLHNTFHLFHAMPDAQGLRPVDPFMEFNEANKDSDGDGVPDRLDAFPADAEDFADSDGDGVPDGQDGDRPLFTAFVGDPLSRSVGEVDLRDASDESQQGLLGAGVSMPRRSLDRALIVTADVGDTTQYFPGGHLTAGGGERLILGWPLRLGPSGTDLARDATVTVPYDVSLLSEVLFGTLAVARIDDDDSITLLPPSSGGFTGAVTIAPGHFSQFVVVGQTLPDGGGGGCEAVKGGAVSGGAAAWLLVPLGVVAMGRVRRRVR